MFKLIKFIIGLVIFLILAVIIFGIVIIVLNRGNKPKAKTFTMDKKASEYTTLTVNVDVKDSYVVVKKGKTDYVSINYYGSTTREFTTSVESDLLDNGTLTFKGYQTGKWYNRLFLTFKATKVYGIEVEVPDDVNVNVKTDNGNIRFEGTYGGSLSADTTNGAVILKNVNAISVDANTVNGNIEATSTNTSILFNARTRKGKIVLDNLVSLMNINVINDNGKIEINNSYATYDINLHSGKGDINGSIRLLSDSYYNIHAHAHNGESNIKDSNNAIAILDIFPTLTVTTDNGNINLELKKVIG